MPLQLDKVGVMPLGPNELARSLSRGSPFTKWVTPETEVHRYAFAYLHTLAA